MGPWKLVVCSSLGRRPFCAPGLRLRVLSLHLLEQKVEPGDVAIFAWEAAGGPKD